MNSAPCPTCNQLIFHTDSPTHRCHPPRNVIIPPTDDNHYAGDDEPAIIYAHDAEHAALEFVRLYDLDEGSFPVADGQPMTVLVSYTNPNPAYTNIPLQFTITGEWNPHYTATEEPDNKFNEVEKWPGE